MTAGRRVHVLVVAGARRLLETARFLPALMQLVVAGWRRRGRVQLWIGDSHTMFFAAHWPAPPLTRGGPERFAWHLGPRLMYSLGKSGYPRGVRVAARLLRWSRCEVVPVFVAGEIDVRCHLVPHLERGDGVGFVSRYVRAALAVATAMGASTAVFVAPVPPGDGMQDRAAFPIAGDLDQRVAASAALRRELARSCAAADGPCRAVAVDAAADLADEQGRLRDDVTVDGCHVNDRGATSVRERVALALSRR